MSRQFEANPRRRPLRNADPFKQNGVDLAGATTADEVCLRAFSTEVDGKRYANKYKTIPAFGEVIHPATGEVIRSDTSDSYNLIVRTAGPNRIVPVGTCKGQHKVIQPREGMSLLEGLVDTGELVFSSAGSTGQGARIWVHCDLPGETFEVVPGDEQRVGLTYRDSYDQSSAIALAWDVTRGVCLNVHAQALQGPASKAKRGVNGVKTSVKIRHSGDLKRKLEEAGIVLAAARAQTRVYRDFCAALVSERYSDIEAQASLEVLIPDPDNASPVRSRAKRREIMSLFKGAGAGSTLRGVEGTKWGFWNAVTEYTTHRATKDPARRFASNLTGSGHKLATNAARLLLSV